MLAHLCKGVHSIQNQSHVSLTEPCEIYSYAFFTLQCEIHAGIEQLKKTVVHAQEGTPTLIVHEHDYDIELVRLESQHLSIIFTVDRESQALCHRK